MPRSFSPPPAQGERGAITGYHAQYRCASALILRGLSEGTLEAIRLADAGAGKIDDLQILGRGRLDAYQFKWSLHPQSFTFNDLAGSKGRKPSLIASLAEGWQILRTANPAAYVVPHLVSNDFPATGKSLPGVERAAPPRHFAAFLSEAWEPLQARELDAVSPKWAPVDRRLQRAANCSDTEWRNFTGVCRLEFCSTLDQFPPGGGDAREEDAWEKNVATLTQRLLALVASPRRVVELPCAGLLSLLG